MDELRPNDVPKHLLQMLAVFLIDAEKEKGQHQTDHQHSRRVVSDAAPCENVDGYAHQRAAAEANELAAGEVKGNFRFYFGQVLRDWHKGHLSRLHFVLIFRAFVFDCVAQRKRQIAQIALTLPPLYGNRVERIFHA